MFRTFFYFSVVLMFVSVAIAQNALDPGERFIGKWVHETHDYTDEYGVTVQGERVVIEIERSGDLFIVKRTVSGKGSPNAAIAKSEIVRAKLLNGTLSRDESVAKTWEPDEFPQRVSDTYELSKTGSILTHTTLLFANRTPLPSIVRKPIKFTYRLKRADR